VDLLFDIIAFEFFIKNGTLLDLELEEALAVELFELLSAEF
jgi:hypothetical protein